MLFQSFIAPCWHLPLKRSLFPKELPKCLGSAKSDFGNTDIFHFYMGWPIFAPWQFLLASKPALLPFPKYRRRPRNRISFSRPHILDGRLISYLAPKSYRAISAGSLCLAFQVPLEILLRTYPICLFLVFRPCNSFRKAPHAGKIKNQKNRFYLRKRSAQTNVIT